MDSQEGNVEDRHMPPRREPMPGNDPQEIISEIFVRYLADPGSLDLSSLLRMSEFIATHPHPAHPESDENSTTELQIAASRVLIEALMRNSQLQ